MKNVLFLTLFLAVAWSAAPAHAQKKEVTKYDVVLEWCKIALDAVAVDHSFPELGSDQGGPTRTSRALAIVHLAIYDAANAVKGDYHSYIPYLYKDKQASYDVAVAYAAYETLYALYPSQADVFYRKLQYTIQREKNKKAFSKGKALGQYVAHALLTIRAFDGSDDDGEYVPTGEPGNHDVDPLNPGQGFLGYTWGQVKPFGIKSLVAVALPPPPALDSEEYTEAYDEVKEFGSKESEVRTEEQEEIGIYWGYDGAIGLGTPPRLYNQVVLEILKTKKLSSLEHAKILALVNMSMADAGIAAWKYKWEYAFWRPILAIRNGEYDDNDDTEGDEEWEPLGAPKSNDPGADNFTPNFPAYASGHATFGAAAFHTVRKYFNSDKINIYFVSDELNGVTTDNEGNVRPYSPRHFSSISQMIEENGQSRIYLGIHWSFDKTEGIKQGIKIADEIGHHYFGKKKGKY